MASALKAPASPGAVMCSQTEQAKLYFSEMQTLLQLPNLSGTVGYWDDGQMTKASLLDVVAKLRHQYVDIRS
jgi:hypothetical protein